MYELTKDFEEESIFFPQPPPPRYQVTEVASHPNQSKTNEYQLQVFL